MIKQYLQFIQQNLQNTQLNEVKQWVDTTLAATFKKNPELSQNVAEIEHILDYLLSDKAPKRLQKMSFMQAKQAAEKWATMLQKKGDHIPETEQDVKPMLRHKKTGMMLVKLVGENAFKREGYLMRNCVASYYDKKTCEVYSLRDINNNPHVTIEVQKQNNLINQIKGKGNGPIHPDYIQYVLKVLKYFKMEIRDTELNNLGYNTLSEEYWKFIQDNFSQIKLQTLTYKGKKYLYKYQQGLSESIKK